MKPIKLITLMTDFGYQDPYVGVMKGVIKKKNPSLQVVDISHGIEPQNLIMARFFLENSLPFFPKDTVYCVVVDPGVGTLRKPILVETENGIFIGPDNGIFSPVFAREKNYIVREITNSHLFLKDLSSTFHGRDVFASSAAMIATGFPLNEVGDIIEDYNKTQNPKAEVTLHSVKGNILFSDHFGNLITNIHQDYFYKKDIQSISFSNQEVIKFCCYSDAPFKTIGCLVGGHNYLEFFLREASLKNKFENFKEITTQIDF